MFLKNFQKIFLPSKSWKNHPQKLLRIPQIHFFSLTASTAKMAQTKESMFQNVAYGPTVYRTGVQANVLSFTTLIVSVDPPRESLTPEIEGKLWHKVHV